MTPDECSYFQRLGARVAKARRRAYLTQVQLADALGISQPQLAFYEVGRRRVPVSMLPALARVLATPIEALIGDDGAHGAAPVTPRRARRGPVSRLEQQFDAIARLPKVEQRAVSTLLDAMLAGSHSRETAATGGTSVPERRRGPAPRRPPRGACQQLYTTERGAFPF